MVYNIRYRQLEWYRAKTAPLDLITVLNINEITKKWLNDNNICYDKIYTEVLNKLDIIKKEEIDIMIDDDYYVCSQVSNYGKQAFLMNLESNEDKKVDDNVIRIFSWIQLYKKIKSIGVKEA